MTPAARLQAAIEVLDEVIASAREHGPPADTIVTRYFKHRRYAGAKDRRAVRELVFRAIRSTAQVPESGRAAIFALAREQPDLLELFGKERGPAPLTQFEAEAAPEPGFVPEWLKSELSPLVTADEWPALLERAPVDLRVNLARASRDELLSEFPEATATPISPWGIRLPPDSRVDDHPAFVEGRAEIQDEGSQLIALACELKGNEGMIDLCAGAGGKVLALASAAPGARFLATDSNRARLARLAPRARRAGVDIETRLLDPPSELETLSDWRSQADVVLVDAPCSGSGTWRRSPEGRWRLTPARLDKLVALQERLLDLASELVRPNGRIIYAVCSIVAREGSAQIQRFLERHSSWISEDTAIAAGRPDGAGRLLTPAHDRTDGFFIARIRRSC
jgi:16S rRNA (cytosine967-C5)-methyltransferase